MEQVPQMPLLPAAGQPVNGEDVFAAEEARTKRAHLSDNTSPEAKRQRGEDSIRVFHITASAGGHPVQPQLLPLIQQLLQGQQRLEARMDNMHIRSLNRRSIADSAALQPLRREVQQAAAGGAVPGDLPPAGVFPADTQALFDLTHAQLDALEDFYGRPFAGGSVVARRTAAIAFVSA